MIAATTVLVAALAASPVPQSVPPSSQAMAPAATGDVVADIRVHGNHIATDAEVVAIAGVTIGAPFTSTTIGDITARLRASKRFDHVIVLKRFTSIEDPTRILIMILVDEGPVQVKLGKTVGAPYQVVRRGFLKNLMVAPVLDGQDGYGLTYGADVAIAHVTSADGRVSFPLTWGGLKQAGAEFDRPMASGPFSRLQIGGDVQRQKNPAFEIDDGRRQVWGRVERAIGPWRAGVTTGWQHVAFAETRDRFSSVLGDLTFDTRADPVLPRNAVLATASIERAAFASGGATNITNLAASGWIGLVGQTVLILQANRQDANHPLPAYLQPILGGWPGLRGFKAGSFVGDTLVAGSLELRVPLTSAVHVGKVGVSGFVDSGTVYDKGQLLRDTPFHTGVGGSVWIVATVFQISVAVAHGIGAGTRVNFGGGLSF